MAKKLLTKDQKLINEVENVLKQNNTKYVKYKCGENDQIIAVLNRNGEHLRKAAESNGSGKKYFFGVLRNHPEYSVPAHLLIKLNRNV